MRVKRLLHWVCEIDSSVGSVTLKGLRGKKAVEGVIDLPSDPLPTVSPPAVSGDDT